MKLKIYLPEPCQQISAAPEEIPLKNLNWITLQRGEVTSVDLHPGELCRLVSRCGVGWVTMEGDAVDHVLDQSAVLHFTGPGRMVIEPVVCEILEILIRKGELTDRSS